MEFPDAGVIESLLDARSWPRFIRIEYRPETPTVSDLVKATESAVSSVPLDIPPGSTVGVAVGSRGIHGIDVVTETVVDRLRAAGHEPVILPAMGSHGGATAAGQEEILDGLGIGSNQLGCPVDARMDTTVIGTTSVGGRSVDVHVATAALEVDAVLPINRVKPHTGFAGPVESGLCKMLIVGLGKQTGARAAHQTVVRSGFDDYVDAVLPVLSEALEIPGGIAIVENFEDRTAAIEGVPGDALIATESSLLERAASYMPTLPFEELDVLVVDQIGKDVSGTGMDTNVIGRSDWTQHPSIPGPSISRIYVRGLSEETHGNAHGVGMADVIHRDIVDEVALEPTYANALTSGALTNAAVPLTLPTDETALRAVVSSIGSPQPEELRIAWIQDTGSLEHFRVSSALLPETDRPEMTRETEERLVFSDGAAVFEPIE